MTLVYITLGWIAGIILANGNPQIAPIWPWLVGGGLIAALLRRRESVPRQIGLCLIAAGLGIGRFIAVQPQITASDIASYNDKGDFDMTGIVVDAPDVRDKEIQLHVEVQSIRAIGQGSTTQSVHGVVLVYAERSGIFNYGDKLSIRGQPVTPPTFDTFSYEDYLAQRGIYTLVGCFPAGCPHIITLAHDQGSPILAALYDLKEKSRLLIAQLLPEPQSGLLEAMLLNDTQGVSVDIRDALSQTGTSHLIVVSGAKVAIIGGLLFALFGKIKNRWASALLIIAGLVLYTVFTGASAATLRAMIMAILVLLAQRFGRQSDGLTALAFSVLLITVANPVDLFDLGLIMSSVATLGLILYMQPLTRLVEHTLARFFAPETAKHVIEIVAEGVLLTFAVEITTWPIIALVFGTFSAISLLTNVLVFPVQGVIVLGGLLAVITGFVWLPIGQAIAWVVGVVLSYTLGVIRGTATLPGAAQTVALSPVIAIFYYGILFSMTVYLSQPAEKRKTLFATLNKAISIPVILVGAAVAVLVWVLVLSRPDGQLHVWFLAVGKGNAILIQTPHGAHWLIDGGDNPTQLSTAIGDRLPFYQRDLDALIITEHKPETITALPPLFDRYNVKAVLSNGQIVDSDPYRALQVSLDKFSTPTISVLAGYHLQSDDGVQLAVVEPAVIPILKVKSKIPGGQDQLVPADAPLILRLTYGNASFLLSSELADTDIQAFLDDYPTLNSTVLQLPSNGSDKANPPAWITAVAPQVAIVEAEAGNHNAQPADSALKAFENKPLYRTDSQGSIEISTDGNQLWLHTEK